VEEEIFWVGMGSEQGPSSKFVHLMEKHFIPINDYVLNISSLLFFQS
jgi:hypothetical protein